jgi:8-oxo-dGTP diphosphatase
MKIRYIAVIIFYDDKKRILLQDRKGISKFGNEWGFFGGGIEENETPEQSIIRETKEELDFDLKQFRYIGKYDGKLNEDFSVVLHVFVSPLNDNLSKFKQKEGRGMKLFSLTEAEKLKIPEHAKRVIIDLKNVI